MSTNRAKAAAHKAPKQPSVLESRFMTLWDVLGGPALEREYKFHPKRRWKADFASHEAQVLIEVEGGVWTRGRHLSPKGFINDAEKYLAATLMGWSVLRLVSDQLTPELLGEIIAYVRDRIAKRPL